MFDTLSSILIFSGACILLLLWVGISTTKSINEQIRRCEMIRKRLELEIAAREADEAEGDNE